MMPAMYPARGVFAEEYEPVARVFAAQLASREEVGGSFAVYHRGELVLDLWGGSADPRRGFPWEQGSSCVVFSVTKGLTAMALHLLAARGALDWEAPVSELWPGFGRAGKEKISLRTLMNHRAGLPVLDERLSIDDCVDPGRAWRVRWAIERQRPLWEPGSEQGYHAVTFGMYAREIIERVAGESAGALLRRELFEPLGVEAWVGTPPAEQGRIAAVLSPPPAVRLLKLGVAGLKNEGPEGLLARSLLRPSALASRAFLNPPPGRAGPALYGTPPVVGSELLWASATATARGLARAYQPFAQGGVVDGKRFFDAASIAPLRARQSFAPRDAVLQKALGWSQGFLKEEAGIFSPHEEAFGHAGMGGALGWCDPVAGLSLGYVMNSMDWRIRSPRTLALCRALYSCEPVRADLRR